MLFTKRQLTLGILAGMGTLGAARPASAQSTTSTPQSTVVLNTSTTLAYQAPNETDPTYVHKRCSGAGGMDTTVNFDPQTGELFAFFTMSTKWGGTTGLNTGMQAGLLTSKITTTGLTTPQLKTLALQGYNGEQRVFMRPNTLLGKDFVAVVFADENDGPNANGNPQPVTWIFDRHTLNQLNVTNAGNVGQGPTDPINLFTLSGDNDDQQLSPHSFCKLADEADGSESWIIGLQYNNTQARVMKVNYKTDGAGGVQVNVPYETVIEGTAQHTRPMFACPPPNATTSGQVAGKYIVATTVEADVRPADYGVRAILVDVTTGKKVSSTRVVNPDANNNVWAVQPTAQYINENVVAIQYQMTNAPYDRHDNGGNVGDPDNHTGAPNVAYLTTLSVPAPGADFQVIQSAPRVASYSRHAEAFGMQYGPDGNTSAAVGVTSGASTGLSAGLLQVIPIKPDGTFEPTPDPLKLYEVSKYSDVANLPAMTKKDPDQGRGFIHSYYGVPNPGYRIASGFMPEVKTFSVSAVAGLLNPNTDNRDSVQFTLVPATWDPNVATTPGSATNNVPPGPSPSPPKGTPVTNPTGPSAGGGSPGAGGSTGGSAGGGGYRTGFGATTSASSGCGCTTAGSDTTPASSGFATLGLGFALLGLRRRGGKKES
jgi:MYXO-CTERM domain-containing protein